MVVGDTNVQAKYGPTKSYHAMTDEEFRALWSEIGEGITHDLREFLRLEENYKPDDESLDQIRINLDISHHKNRVAIAMYKYFGDPELFGQIVTFGISDLIAHSRKNNFL